MELANVLVYVLFNKSANKIYVGQTKDLVTRLKRRNREIAFSKKSYTVRNKGEWNVLFTEEYKTRSESINREKQLKSQKGREFIWKMIT